MKRNFVTLQRVLGAVCLCMCISASVCTGIFLRVCAGRERGIIKIGGNNYAKGFFSSMSLAVATASMVNLPTLVKILTTYSDDNAQKHGV